MRHIRSNIINYICPKVVLFPATYALAFGTRHGLNEFANDIAELHDARMFKKIVISGGVTPGQESSEAQCMLNKLTKLGMDDSDVILEERSKNTGDNVRLSRTHFVENGIEVNRLLLIGKLSSSRRYLMTIRKQWPEIEHVCIHNVNYFGVERANWWKCPDFRQRILIECRKIPIYVERGYIAEVRIRAGHVNLKP